MNKCNDDDWGWVKGREKWYQVESLKAPPAMKEWPDMNLEWMLQLGMTDE